MELKEQLSEALEELKKGKERKFDQTIDLIVNLQKIDIRKNPVNIFTNVPHRIKDKKIAAFLEVRNKNIETITKEEFRKYSDKKELKKLSKRFDFFIAQASLMPKVATTFGRFLGPSGKMPSPQLGIMMTVDDKIIEELKQKINNSIKIRAKDASIKLAIGKQSMKTEDVIENILSVYETILKVLPREKDNVKNIEIKYTMSKPQKISVR